MKKKNISMFTVMVTIVIVLIVCILSNISESEAINTYDKEATLTIDGTDGGVLIKEKKYNYNGANVMILSVENQTENAYTIIIKSLFTKEDGTKEQKFQRFTGFPAGYQNYFVIQPGFRFVDYEYEIITQPFSGETLTEHISWGNDLIVEAQPFTTDIYGNPLDEYITYFSCFLDSEYEFPENSCVSLAMDIVIFDNLGEIYLIENKNGKFDTSVEKEKFSGLLRIHGELLDTPWKDYKLPPELKGDIKAIVALKSIELVEE